MSVRFSCPYKSCGSMCCVSGDRGAPATREEIMAIEKAQTRVAPGLDSECRQEIERSGIYEEADGTLNIQCLNGEGRCVYSVKGEYGVSCYLETVSREDNIKTLRPVSCRLFPLRIRRYNGIVILDFELWDECRDAWNKGEYLLDYCRDGLLDTFGQQWLERLDVVRKKVLESEASTDLPD